MKIIASMLLAECLVLPLHALELPAIFADHMVLQRDMPVPVWGKARRGDSVKVDFGEAQATATADNAGDWRVHLPPMPASDTPREMSVVVTASHGVAAEPAAQTYSDVLVGDVWHCGGQSNMEWPVSKSNDAEDTIAAADFPAIRLFLVPDTDAELPQFTSGGVWKTTTPDTVGGFSAVAYFFARKIHESQGVPIGLVVTSWGAASAEAYTSMPTLLADPLTAAHVEQMSARSPDDESFRKQHTPAALFHGMIHPVAPFAHRGVLWYQGESNANHGRAVAYRDLLPRMIEDWRSLWNQPAEHRDTPFLIVQLANFRQPTEQPPAHDGWAELRDAQAHVAATVPNAYLATAIDLGDADDIHPRNKQDVGLRLARLAEQHVYGDKSVVPVGPTYRIHAVHHDMPTNTIVFFDYREGLRTTDGQPPRGFAIRPAGTNSPWAWAQTTLEAKLEAVRLTHPEGVNGPFDIRYAYGVNPTDGPQGINLVNGEGLPAMPFRTDLLPTAE